MTGRFPSYLCTRWHSTLADATTPGQPGVFEVNKVDTFDSDFTAYIPRRFSFWNGHAWGPVAPTPELAHQRRLNFADPAITATITAFRGLTKEH